MFVIDGGNCAGHALYQVSLPVFQWPVYVLMGNGDVYTFLSSLQSNRYYFLLPSLSGPFVKSVG